jgi:hypothetical protein
MRALLGMAAEPWLVGGSLAGLAVHSAELMTRLLTLSSQDPEPGDLLLRMASCADTSVEALSAIKDRAKVYLERSRTPEDRAASTLLYHTAIAAAYGFHGATISSRGIRPYLALYDDLAAALGDESLKTPFARAAARGEPAARSSDT